MNTVKEIHREIIKSIIWLAIGLTALFIGNVTNFEKNTMEGIAIGFISVGIGQILIYSYAKKNPKMIKNIELEKEERNIFINTKAGHTAFWISFWYVITVAVFSNVLKITLLQFSIFTVFFMPVVYFTFIYIYHKKY